MRHSVSLNGLKVLITRPEQQSGTLVSVIKSLGGDTFDFPLLELEAIKDEHAIQLLEQKVKKLNGYDKLIFVSKNAVWFGAEIISKIWSKLPLEGDVLAIGPGTAKMASDFFGCEVIHPNSGSVGEDLVALPPLTDVKQKRVAIFRGTGGREFLAESLINRGAEVDYFEVYQRSPTRRSSNELLKIINEHSVNVLTISSGDSLVVLNKLLLDSKNSCNNLFSIPVIVPSARVSQLAQKLGFEQVKLASGAHTEATISTLYEVASELNKSDDNPKGG